MALKNHFIAALGFVVFGTASAFAADLPTKAPVYTKAPAIAVYNWTGFYIGVQGGWSQIRDSQVLSSPVFVLPVASRASGGVGGAHAGYNYQVNQFVVGVEGDIEGSSVRNTYLIGPPFVVGTFGTNNLNWEGSVRARAGIAVDRVLFYGTAGWAFGGFNDGYNAAVLAPAFVQNVSSTRNGWTAGAGVEYALPSNWTVRAEYRYTDWGTYTNNLNVFLAPPGTSVDKVTQQTVRVGVSYKFGGPVIAKY
jgi:outer membrane immunogenic protein